MESDREGLQSCWKGTAVSHLACLTAPFPRTCGQCSPSWQDRRRRPAVCSIPRQPTLWLELTLVSSVQTRSPPRSIQGSIQPRLSTAAALCAWARWMRVETGYGRPRTGWHDRAGGGSMQDHPRPKRDQAAGVPIMHPTRGRAQRRKALVRMSAVGADADVDRPPAPDRQRLCSN